MKMRKFTHFVMSLLMAGSVMTANAQDKPEVTLTVDGVQAANLETYYQTRGSWEFVFANGDDLVATLAVTTSGYNHIAGQYDLAGSESVITLGDEDPVTGGTLTVTYVSEGVDYPVYTFDGSIETASTIYKLDLTSEVFAYDYLYYLYYEMGAFTFQQILVQLDDAPDDAEHDTYELAMNQGFLDNYIDLMGALQIRAENEDGLIVQVILDADELLDNTTYPMSTTYAVYCYLGDMNTQTYLAYFKSGSVKLKATAEGVVTADATLNAKGGDVYHIVMTDLECPGIVPDEELNSLQIAEIMRQLASKRMVNGKLVIEHNGVTWGAEGVMTSK